MKFDPFKFAKDTVTKNSDKINNAIIRSRGLVHPELDGLDISASEFDPDKWTEYSETDDNGDFVVVAKRNKNNGILSKLPNININAGQIKRPFEFPKPGSTSDERFMQFDTRLPYYMASGDNRTLVDPMNLSYAVSVYKKTLLGDNPKQAKKDHQVFKNDGNVYGVPAIMNPYSAIRLFGALEVSTVRNGKKMVNQNYMIDRQRRRKFYDVTGGDSDETKSMVSVPSTTNIIKWGGQDKWGRTPYKFQDFVFCKYWKQIENNRLITLRRYQIPTQDNLNFDDMYDGNNKSSTTFSPLSTMVTYFGGDSGNKLSQLLAFSCGYRWKDAKSEIFKVTKMGGNSFTSEDGSANNFTGIMDGIVSGMGSMITQNPYTQMYGTIVSLFLGDKSDINESAMYDRGNYPNPYDKGPWMNKLMGPVNSIDTVRMRDIGLNFNQTSLSVKFTYVARPVGGINTKAVMLDILANALVMGYSSAVFWQGGRKFQIKPSLLKPKGIIAELTRSLAKGDYETAIDKICKLLTDIATLPDINDLIDMVKKGAKGLMNDASNVKDAISDIGAEMSAADAANEVLTDIGAAPNKVSHESVEKLMGSINSVADGKGGALVTGLLKYILNMTGTMRFLSNYGALLNGNPVGDWHLTIGNPFNPIATIGNLICKNMKVVFSDDLGPDDFPTEMEITYDLEHGMPRDSDSIQSMFNRGVGRIYTLPDWAKTSSDYMTQVDDSIGAKDDGSVTKGWSQETMQQLNLIYDYEDGEQRISKGGEFAGDVHHKIMTPTNSGSPVMNIPKFVPVDYNQLISLADTKDLSNASRGIFYIDDASKYAKFVNTI